ncbi:MAG: hypothetical protein AB7H77_11235 [Bdellovibrionales bacterium]
MHKVDFTSLAIASVLAAFLVVPTLAEDTQETRPEPVYVWQGNRTPATAAQPSSSTMEIPAHAAAEGDPSLPQPVQTENVRYITGGIGDEERDALNSVKQRYNLHVTSTNMQGEFNGSTQIIVRDRQDNTTLKVDAGPLFYADLPAGSYTVEAVNGGQKKEQKISLAQGKSASLYFRW